jgi:dTMP kinase
MLITFEGIEGSGKSTQCALLRDWLQGQGWPVTSSKEPGGTRLGLQIRGLLLDSANHDMTDRCELFLYLADRAQHVSEVLRPALEQGRIVLIDRFSDSTLAYQGFGRELDLERLMELNSLATGGLNPDLTILIDLPAEQGLQRAKSRNMEQQLCQSEGRFEEELLPFHRRVRDGFLRLAGKEPGRFRIFDGSRSQEAIGQEVRAAVAGLLGYREAPEP